MRAAMTAAQEVQARVDDLFATHEQRRNTLLFLARLRLNQMAGFDELIETYLRRAAPASDRDVWFSELIDAVRDRRGAEVRCDEAAVQEECVRVEDALANLCREATL